VTRRGADPGSCREEARQRGQGLVEFALFVPLFLVLLLAMLDFGFALYTNLTLEYASREGARVGAALAAGNSTTLPCAYDPAKPASVDDHVIAAVQRVLQSAGISVPLTNADPTKSRVNWIRIYKATNYVDGSGYEVAGNYNEWTYAATGGHTVDGTTLTFVGPVTPSWSACTRLNGATPDKIGVAINYTYAWTTPLTSAFRLIGSGASFFSNLTFLDKTVMNLNPTFP
jgi:Flp pilus assembly protein TadG